MWRRDPTTAPKPPAPSGELLAAFPRDDGRSSIRYTLDTYNDRPYVGVRAWVHGDGGWWPTKVGLTIRARELDEVIAALQRARALIAGEKPAKALEAQQSLPWQEPTYVERNRRPVARERPGPAVPAPTPDVEPFDESD